MHTNNLLLVAVQTQGTPPPIISAPVTTTWTSIADDISGTTPDFRQDYFFHVVTAGEDGTLPTYTFIFSGSTLGEAGVIAYDHTCLDNTGGFSACTDPIFASQSASTNSSATVSTGAAAFAFPADGTDVAVFGSKETGSNIASPSGGMAAHCADATNSAMFFADKPEGAPAGTDGPFTATSEAAGDNVGQAVSVCAENTTTCP